MADSDAKAQAQAFFDSLPAHIPRPEAILTSKEARQRADKIQHELFKSWYQLKETVHVHEETIRKRWKKRTAVKRKQLLQEIDPKLPKEHAPEISALAQDDPSARQAKRNDFMLPYLNLEDLSINNGTQFLGLLHARVYHSPSEFAWFDNNTLNFGIVAGGIKRFHGLDCGMIAFGDEATYGKVLGYSEFLDKSDRDSPDGAQMEHLLRESMSFGDGLAVLEMRSKLMGFLLAVVNKILIDLDLGDLKPATLLPAPAIPILNTTFQWQSSARSNALRPYGPPPVFSIDQIAVLLESQYELAVQHVADLRTDPVYLAETIQSYYAHRLETILGKAPPSLIQDRAISLMLSDAYSFLAVKTLIQCYDLVLMLVFIALIDDFRVVQTTFPNGVARARDLPREYENALMNFHPILGLLETRLTKRHHSTFCSASALASGRTVRCTDPAFEKNFATFKGQPGDKLYGYMVLLLQEEQVHLWQVVRIFDQLDRITQDPIQHQRVSPLIANLLSQWGVVNDCKSILDWHRPAVEPSEEIQAAAQTRPSPCPVLSADRELVKTCGTELLALGTLVVAPFAVGPTDWVALSTPKVPTGRGKPTRAALLPFGGAVQTAAAKEELPHVKEKPKTRGVPAVTENANHTPAEQIFVAVPSAPVSAKVYRVFSTLFNATKDEEIALQQSSVAWKDIQAAFAQLKFVLQKTRGSAWTFRHPDGQRSVTAASGVDDEILGSASVRPALNTSVWVVTGILRSGDWDHSGLMDDSNARPEYDAYASEHVC
ncbi:hypothetical protein DFH09DRAFT_1282386 [Mycena vulgaris]|nr:hypothetical protein DFH09DRAFT_1282386 [Mycena vulgaris]